MLVIFFKGTKFRAHTALQKVLTAAFFFFFLLLYFSFCFSNKLQVQIAIAISMLQQCSARSVVLTAR